MKKEMGKKVLSVIVAMITGTIICGGCSKTKTTNVNGDGSVSVAVFDRGSVPSDEGTYENNRWTEYIVEQSGVNVNYVAIPRSEAQQKYNALFAAEEAPDIVIEYDRKYLINLVNQGVLQPVGDFIDKYSTEYKEYIEKNDDLRKYTQYDGEEYFITSKRPNSLNHGIWIRQDWLDNLGLEMPKTDEDLLNVARAFRDGDPDGNGKDDTTAFSLKNYMQIFQAMYMANPLWYENAEGKLEFGYVTDGVYDYVRILKTIYDEKLMDAEIVSDKEGINQTQLWVNGKAGIKFGSALEDNTELMLNNPNAKPVALAPITTKYGQNAYWQEESPNFYLAFNRNMKNPEAAMKFVDWMITEGWKPLTYGEENVHYQVVNGLEKTLDKQKFKAEVAWANGYAILSNATESGESIIAKAADDEMSQIIAKQKADAFEKNVAVKFRRDIADPCIEDVLDVLSDYEPIVYENAVKVMMGGAEYDIEWFKEKNESEWKRLGGETAEKLINEWYSENK